MPAIPSHRIERERYVLTETLLQALLVDDRHEFDERLREADADRSEAHADIIAIALNVAESTRWPFPFVHRRPRDHVRAAVVDDLASSGFADLVDEDLAAMLLRRLYQRVYIDPVVMSPDLVSMTTSLGIAAWTLSNQIGFPFDRHKRVLSGYRGCARGLRLRGLRTYEWFRRELPDEHGSPVAE